MSAAKTLARARATRAGSARIWISYARLSKASERKSDGGGASMQIADQHARNRAYILALDPGAEIVELTDDGFSAFKDIVRPDFEKALGMIRAGGVFAFVGWHSDRISRQMEVTARLWRICETAGTEVHTAIGAKHDDPDSLYFETLIAERAARQMRNRMLASHEGKAKRGETSGGIRAFGYDRVRLPGGGTSFAVNPAEKVLVDEAVSRVMAGEGLNTIASDWTARGIPTVRGGTKWRPGVLKKMLTGPVLAGRREHRPKDGPVTIVENAWPAIIDPATHTALVRRLTDPERRTNLDNSAKYLLSGIATCGNCGAKMNGARQHDAAKVRTVYRCTACHKVTRVMGPVDELVTEWVLDWLEGSPEVLAVEQDNREAEALAVELAAVEAREKTAVRAFARGAFGEGDEAADMLAEARAEIRAERATIEAALGRLADKAAEPHRVLEGATGPDARQTWEAWASDTSGEGLARRRAITDFLVTVRIDPTARGGRKFNREAVHVAYRDFG